MRVQTTFEKIAQGTSRQVFAACFIALRIALGVACVYAATQLMSVGAFTTDIEPGTTSYAMQLADFQAMQAILAPILVVLGLVFILGVLIRPVALLAIALIIFSILTSGTNNPEGAILGYGLVALGLSLFAAGGSGHALGLDGIISRNIRRPNFLTKFLFG